MIETGTAWHPSFSFVRCRGGSGRDSDLSLPVGVCQHPRRLMNAVITFGALVLAAGNVCTIAYLAKMQILDREVMLFGLSIACPVITILAYVSPLPTVMEALKSSDAQSLNPELYEVQAASNVLGIAYGLQILNAAVLITNLFGLACQILYLASAHYLMAENRRWIRFAIKFSIVLNLSIFLCRRDASSNLLGHGMSFFNLLLSSTPLLRLEQILRSRNASVYPVFMTLVSVVNNIAWTLYGILIEDAVVFLPSVYSFTVATFQVLVILWCRRQLPFDLSFLLVLFPDRSPVKKDEQITPQQQEEEIPLRSWL
jgi:uncharacterized protein with PQ loop repeat